MSMAILQKAPKKLNKLENYEIDFFLQIVADLNHWEKDVNAIKYKSA